jgi:hypothetical protein
VEKLLAEKKDDSDSGIVINQGYLAEKGFY